MLKFLVILNGNTFSVDGVSFAELRELLPDLRAWLNATGTAPDVPALIHRLREDVMAKFEDVKALQQATNEITNTMAGKVDTVVESEAKQLALIEELKRQIAEGTPVSQAQLDELGAGMQTTHDALKAAADKLRTIAADPENPIPEEPSEPTDTNARRR